MIVIFKPQSHILSQVFFCHISWLLKTSASDNLWLWLTSRCCRCSVLVHSHPLNTNTKKEHNEKGEKEKTQKRGCFERVRLKMSLWSDNVAIHHSGFYWFWQNDQTEAIWILQLSLHKQYFLFLWCYKCWLLIDLFMSTSCSLYAAGRFPALKPTVITTAPQMSL